MQRFTITTTNFLNWYFNTGADQEQESILESLGKRIKDELMEHGKSKVTAKDLFDECNPEWIPLNLTEEYNAKFHTDRVLSELKDNWIIKLIK